MDNCSIGGTPEVNNIQVTSSIAGAGVAGAVFGMAMQDVFRTMLMAAIY